MRFKRASALAALIAVLAGIAGNPLLAMYEIAANRDPASADLEIRQAHDLRASALPADPRTDSDVRSRVRCLADECASAGASLLPMAAPRFGRTAVSGALQHHGGGDNLLRLHCLLTI